MDYLAPIKTYAGWLIFPLAWLAYFTDYGVTHINLDIHFLPVKLIYGLRVFITIMLAVTIIILFKAICDGLSIVVFGESFYPIIAIALLCFGVVALFKNLEITPFKEVNIFWHLVSLAAGFWIFSDLKERSNLNT